MNPRTRRTRRLGAGMAGVVLLLTVPFLAATSCQNATAPQTSAQLAATAAQQAALVPPAQANVAAAQASNNAAATAAAQATLTQLLALQTDNANLKQQLAAATTTNPAVPAIQTGVAAIPGWGTIAAGLLGLGIVGIQQLKVNKVSASAATNQQSTDALAAVVQQAQNHPNPAVASAMTAAVSDANLPTAAKLAIQAQATT